MILDLIPDNLDFDEPAIEPRHTISVPLDCDNHILKNDGPADS
jgi:hypothetical protein